jgi:hypothetical protein
MAQVYRRFGGESPSLDYSETAAVAMYRFESTGRGDLRLGVFQIGPGGALNGYAVGKHWMDATVKMWREDLRTLVLFRSELEGEFPGWFLDRVLGPARRGARNPQDPSGGRETE